MRRSDRTKEGPPTLRMSRDCKESGRGPVNFFGSKIAELSN